MEDDIVMTISTDRSNRKPFMTSSERSPQENAILANQAREDKVGSSRISSSGAGVLVCGSGLGRLVPKYSLRLTVTSETNMTPE